MNRVSLSLHLVGELRIRVSGQPGQLDPKPIRFCYRNVTSQQSGGKIVRRKLILCRTWRSTDDPYPMRESLLRSGVNFTWDGNQLWLGLGRRERGRSEQKGSSA